MSLEAFLHELHAGLERTKAGDYEIDWEDAPLPYKLYRGLPVVALSADVPLTLDEPVHQPRARPELREFGHFLWYVYGLTQLSQSPLAQGEQCSQPEDSFPRAVACIRVSFTCI